MPTDPESIVVNGREYVPVERIAQERVATVRDFIDRALPAIVRAMEADRAD